MNDLKSEMLRGQPVSGVFQDFVEPLVIEWSQMSPRPSIDELNKMCRFPWTVWNAIVYKDFCPDAIEMDCIEWMHRLLAQNDTVKASGHAVLDLFVRRKREMFGEYRYLFGNAEFYRSPEGEMRCRAEAVLPKGVSMDDLLRNKRPHVDASQTRFSKWKNRLDHITGKWHRNQMGTSSPG